MTQSPRKRDWGAIERRHRAFWNSEEVERPLVYVIYDAYVDTELVAATLGEGETSPDDIDPRAILPEYDKVAAARDAIDDDAIAVAEPLLGIPWLEAIAGCRVVVPQGKSIWPEPPEGVSTGDPIVFDPENPWFLKLLQLLYTVVDHARGRYAVGLSHLRGPTDILIARFGSERFFTLFYEAPERVQALALQCAELWRQVVEAEMRIVPPYRGGYGVRQFGLWAPERSVWLQDDTSAMMSPRHYRRFFLDPLAQMSYLPYGVLHLHIGSLHVAEMLADVPNVRAINFYFDDPKVSLQQAMPVLQRLQARGMPLILAKTVYEGFSMDEYQEILDGLAPRGLSVHLCADSVAEGVAVMEAVRETATPSVGAWSHTGIP
jgi:hypothetical protein